MNKVKVEDDQNSNRAKFSKDTTEEWQVDYELHRLPKGFPIGVLLDLLNEGKLYQKIDRKENLINGLYSNEQFTVYEKIET